MKTRRFGKPRYIGDVINAVRIFNDKEADEILVVDIEATPQRRSPNFETVRSLASECFMPLAYGGGVRSIDDMDRLFGSGVEKVAINTAALSDPGLITAGATKFGGQSIVGVVDVRHRRLGGATVVGSSGKKRSRATPVEHARALETAGAGELLVQSVDRDGTGTGYDLATLSSVTQAVAVPVIALGGAGTAEHLAEAALLGGASASAAGSMFVFHGRQQGVLINMPSQASLEEAWARTGARAQGTPPQRRGGVSG